VVTNQVAVTILLSCDDKGGTPRPVFFWGARPDNSGGGQTFFDAGAFLKPSRAVPLYSGSPTSVFAFHNQPQVLGGPPARVSAWRKQLQAMAWCASGLKPRTRSPPNHPAHAPCISYYSCPQFFLPINPGPVDPGPGFLGPRAPAPPSPAPAMPAPSPPPRPCAPLLAAFKWAKIAPSPPKSPGPPKRIPAAISPQKTAGKLNQQ